MKTHPPLQVWFDYYVGFPQTEDDQAAIGRFLSYVSAEMPSDKHPLHGDIKRVRMLVRLLAPHHSEGWVELALRGIAIASGVKIRVLKVLLSRAVGGEA